MPSKLQARQDPYLPVYVGCFSSSFPLKNQGYYKYQSSGWCAGICYGKDEPAFGLANGTLCYCGSFLPYTASKVVDSRCDTPCQGYDLENCGGGASFFSIYLTGYELNVDHVELSTTTTSKSQSTATATTRSSKSSASRTTTSSQQTHGQSTLASSTSASHGAQGTGAVAAGSTSISRSNHHTRLAIILGVVLGVLALAILLALLWWLWRRRKRERSSDVGGKLSPETEHTEKASAVPGEHLESERPVSTLAPLPLPPMFLGFDTRTDTQTSTTTSFDQPFYTPMEESTSAFPATQRSEVSTSTHPQHVTSVVTTTTTTPSGATRTFTSQPSSSQQVPHDPAAEYRTPYDNPFSNEAGGVTEDTGVGYMTVNTDQTTPPVSQVLSPTEHDALDSMMAETAVSKSDFPPGSLLVAMRDFAARSTDELTFAKGDRIVLIERDEKYHDGWYLGQNTASGRTGIFPGVYTESR